MIGVVLAIVFTALTTWMGMSHAYDRGKLDGIREARKLRNLYP